MFISLNMFVSSAFDVPNDFQKPKVAKFFISTVNKNLGIYIIKYCARNRLYAHAQIRRNFECNYYINNSLSSFVQKN